MAPIIMDCDAMRGDLFVLIFAAAEEVSKLGLEPEMDLLMRDTEMESRISSILRILF